MIEKLAVGHKCWYGGRKHTQSTIRKAQRNYKKRVRQDLKKVAAGYLDADDLNLAPVGYGWTD